MTEAGSVSVSDSSFALTVVFNKISTLPRDVGRFVYSDRVMTQHGTSLFLTMYIGGDRVEEKEHCSLFLKTTDAVKLSYSMKLANHIDDKKSINLRVRSDEFKAGDGCGWGSFIETEKLLDPNHGFIVHDAITTILQINVEGKHGSNIRIK